MRVRAVYVLLPAIAVGIVSGGLWLRAQQRTPFERMLAAASAISIRPVEARVCVFPYRPWSRRPDVPRQLLKLRGAAGEVLLTAETTRDDQHRSGVALLFAGQPRRALDKLMAAANSGSIARYWSDLAAAEIAEADSSSNTQQLPRALAAADRALEIDAAMPEALFNRALVLERMNLRELATIAWTRYLACDAESPWAGEARDRLSRLKRRSRREIWNQNVPVLYGAAAAGNRAVIGEITRRFTQHARMWTESVFLGEWGTAVLSGHEELARQRLELICAIGDALAEYRGESLLCDFGRGIRQSSPADRRKLAAASVAFRKARVAFAARSFIESRLLFSDCAAQFERVNCPMALVAHYYAANSAFEASDVATAIRELDDLRRKVPAEYLALRGQIEWERAAGLGKSGDIAAAVRGFEEALEIFDRLEEEDSGNAMRIAIASSLDLLGRPADAWRRRVEWFGRLSDSGSELAQQSALDSTARVAMAAGEWEIGWSFMKLATDPAIRRPDAHMLFEDRVWRALGAFRLGLNRSARADVERAADEARSIRDEHERDLAMNRVSFARAIVLRPTNPAGAITEADRVVGFMAAHSDTYYLPEILLERARSLRAVGRDDEAIADLRRCIDVVDQRRSALGDDLRDSYFSAAAGAASELFDLLDSRGSVIDAFAVTERTRSRFLGDAVSHQLLGATEVCRRLPRGTVVAQYTVLSDRTVIHVLSDRGLVSVSARAPADVLTAHIEGFQRLITNGDRGSANESRALYDLLIRPIEGHLSSASLFVIIPDRRLAEVPFAVLADVSGRHLIERVAIVYSPNATFYVHRFDGGSRAVERALAVGNPSLDARVYPSLPPLTQAEVEANEIADLWRGKALTRERATKAAVLAELVHASIVHFGTHAVIDSSDPRHSCLILAADRDRSTSLEVRDIAALHLEGARLIDLAGCQTAVSVSAPGDIRNLSLAFLAAGARSVVGTLWNIDDVTARRTSIAFHKALIRHGATTATALREVQLSMLRSSNAKERDIRVWGAFQILGTGI